MYVLTISGKAGSGKDTVAEILKKKLEEQCKSVLVIHFADLLKYICKQYFGWDGNKNEAGRTMLQVIGTDIVRKQNPNFWVEFVLSTLRFFNGSWDFVLIPDARFPNEVDLMRDSEFHALNMVVTRTEYVTKLTSEQQNHASETSILEIKSDFNISNDGTLEELETKIIKWIEENITND